MKERIKGKNEVKKNARTLETYKSLPEYSGVKL